MHAFVIHSFNYEIYSAEIGKITLDKTFAERESLNHKITESINKVSSFHFIVVIITEPMMLMCMVWYQLLGW
jgi:hypothetical protein